MAIDRGRVTINGTCNSGEEQWSMTFACGALSGATQEDMDFAAAAVRDQFETNVWETGVTLWASYISDHTTFDSVTLSDIRAVGGTMRVATASSDGTGAGGFSGSPLPAQVAEVVTLTTGLPGARNRGRMYFPALGTAALGSNGRMLEAARDALVSAMAAFLTDVNAITGITVCVYSPTYSQLTPITGIRVGDVFDTQRRRRNELVEAYDSAAVS